jgi:hypothetical protein
LNWNPKCAYCGHVNHPDSEVCGRCDFPLGGDDARDSAGAPPPPYAYDAAPRAPAGWVPSVRFRGAGDVIAPMLEVFRKHFQLVVVFVVVVTAAEALLRYGLALALAPDAGAVDAARVIEPYGFYTAEGVPGALAVWLASLAGFSMLTASFAYAVLDLQLAGATSAAACLRRGLRALPKVFLIHLMYTLATALGYALFIVPGVILSLTYAVAVPAAIAEGAGAFESFARSAELTRGYKGLVFVTYFLWWIAVAVVGYVVSASFTYGGGRYTLPYVAVDALVGGVLNSTTAVLSVFIYLGLLRENGRGLDASAFAHDTAAAAGR